MGFSKIRQHVNDDLHHEEEDGVVEGRYIEECNLLLITMNKEDIHLLRNRSTTISSKQRNPF